MRNDSMRGVRALSDKAIETVERRRAESPENFVEHLLAMPDVGDDSDFEEPRSGPRPVAM